TLNLGQFAGVARQAAQDEFPSAIAPDTLAKLVRAQGEARKVVPPEPVQEPQQVAYVPSAGHPIYTETRAPQNEGRRQPQPPPAEGRQPASAKKRVPRPIQSAAAQVKGPQVKGPQVKGIERSTAPKRKVAKSASQPTVRQAASANQRSAMMPANKALPKLFTEQAGEHRSTALDATEDKEISGIWLVLSIILIVVTAFGAGFLIMKPLLNDR
ncbi:MAG: hypothetical protein AAGL17_11320, partial [Cyanobacteria bacterium J06576_12]